MSAAIVVIVNATAGTGLPDDWAVQLQEKFSKAGLQAQVKVVQSGCTRYQSGPSRVCL